MRNAPKNGVRSRTWLAGGFIVAIVATGWQPRDMQWHLDEALRTSDFPAVLAHYDRDARLVRLSGQAESAIERARAERLVRQVTDSELLILNGILVPDDGSTRLKTGSAITD